MPNFSQRNRRGNYMMTMGSFLPILIGFAALSIDISYVNMSRVQVQHVADAASHAAFVGFRATNDFDVGNDAADFIITKNLVGNSQGALVGPVEYGEWDFETQAFDGASSYVNSARATVARSNAKGNPLNLFFAPLLGYDKWDVQGIGTTSGRSREIMIVQDVSCSFGGTDILNSRDANVAFLEYMNNNPYPGDKLGMTLFGGMTDYPVLQELASVPDNYAKPGSTGGKPNSMLSRFQALNYCSSLPSWSKPRPDWGSKCATTQARGLVQARDEFIDRGDVREFQAVILISDGLPNAGLKYNDGQGKANSERAAAQLWGKDNSGNDSRAWSYTKFQCKTAACSPITWSHVENKNYSTYFDGGVHLWSVTFNEGGGDFSWMGTLIKGMGRAYETPDSDELDDIMVEIASSIPVVLTE